MSDDALCEVVITAPDPAWLAEFARRLVSESRASLHTRHALVPGIYARLEREHPYEVPGFLVLPVLPGSEPYDAWIRHETTP